MFSNQQPSIDSTRHYTYDSPSNDNSRRTFALDQTEPIQSSTSYSNFASSKSVNDRANFGTANNYASANMARFSATDNQSRSYSSGSLGRGTIEKTNMMSSENPYRDPARPYEQFQTPQTITSITSASKNPAGVNKTLNLSDENPFHAIYGNYRYPSQIDPSKRITNQGAALRSTDNKSLNLSDENPFYSTYGRYHYPSQVDAQKRLMEAPKASGPLLAINEPSDQSPFNAYRPSLIRQYSAGLNMNENGSNSFSSSIADWERTHPAPLSYRPIQVQRPPPEFYTPNESSNLSSYIPLSSPQRQLSPMALPSSQPRVQSQSQKPQSSAPLDKTSLNMSPNNPFADAYGRYYYPSPEEIKVQKRTNERSARVSEEQTPVTGRIMQSINPGTEYPEAQTKDSLAENGNNRFARFDLTF